MLSIFMHIYRAAKINESKYNDHYQTQQIQEKYQESSKQVWKHTVYRILKA